MKDILVQKQKRKAVSLAIKVTITLAALFFIYRQIAGREDQDDVIESFRIIAANPQTYFNLLMVTILMFLNWTLEAKKWQLLLSDIRPIGFVKSLISTFSGITVSFFTPNRMGEFIGRILHLEKEERLSAALMSVFGSISQIIVTVFIGCLGAAGIISKHYHFAADHPMLFWTTIIIVLAAFLFIYFKSALLIYFLKKIKLLQKYNSQLDMISNIATSKKIKVLWYSALRYIVFSLQFFILLMTVEVWLAPLLAFKLIATLFLILAIVPGTALTELALRGSVALALFGVYSDNNTGILAAAFLLWFINLVLPAAMGSLSIFFIRLPISKIS